MLFMSAITADCTTFLFAGSGFVGASGCCRTAFSSGPQEAAARSVQVDQSDSTEFGRQWAHAGAARAVQAEEA